MSREQITPPAIPISFQDFLELRNNVNRENANKLHRILNHLDNSFPNDPEARACLRRERLISDAGIRHHDAQALSAMGSNGLASLRHDDHQRLCDYLWEKGFLTGSWQARRMIDTTPHLLFHTINAFLDVKDATLANLRERAIGTYRMWRHSSHLPGYFVRGMMEIFSSIDAPGVVHARETHIFKGAQEARPIKEVTEGYVTRRGNIIYIVSTGASEHGLRTTCLHGARIAVTDKGEQYVTLKGVVMGNTENFVLSAAVYLERVDIRPEELLESLDLVPGEAVPPVVLAKLSHIAEKGVILF
jgi:hypothetical protein